jgi:hypothetical protein
VQEVHLNLKQVMPKSAYDDNYSVFAVHLHSANGFHDIVEQHVSTELYPS